MSESGLETGNKKNKDIEMSISEEENALEINSGESVEAMATNEISEEVQIEEVKESQTEPSAELKSVEEDPVAELVETEEKTVSKNTDIEAIDEIEEEELIELDQDFSQYSKKDFVDLASKLLDASNNRNLTIADIKNIDNASKLLRTGFDDLINQEIIEAKKAYIAENGSEDGFEFRNDNFSIRLEGILIQIKEKRQSFFQNLEREREDNFEVKTKLLEKLREIVEEEEKGESKSNWESFKSLQTQWKEAGNVNSPHNGSLWSTYNALVDRYFDIRSIQHELKELDRKKNIESKEEVVVKIEEIAESLQNNPLNNEILKKANDLLQEYKEIGPGPREEQDALWDRLKKAFDVIYENKRELQKETDHLAEEVFNAKNQIVNNLQAYVNFNSDSINEWNAKSKEVIEIQKQWESIKGRLPRDKAKDLSNNFWKNLKQFFKNKSEFFAKLEEKRNHNLEAKTALVNEAKAILEAGDFSAPNTNKIIDLQKKWKSIGFVPEKYRESIYAEFKGICDQYFDHKREENKSQGDEYSKNLKEKEEICKEIEDSIEKGETSLDLLNDFKKKFAAIGFVPRKDMKSIQERFIKGVNNYIKTLSNVDKSEKSKLILQNEAEVKLKAGGNLNKKEIELRKKIRTLEDEISLTKNNLSFFEFSKNADKLKADYLKKIEKSEAVLAGLYKELKLILAVNQ